MNFIKTISKIANRSNGEAVLKKVPASKKPTADSLKGLEIEVSAQVSANEAMRSRSMQSAVNTVRRG